MSLLHEHYTQTEQRTDETTLYQEQMARGMLDIFKMNLSLGKQGKEIYWFKFGVVS